MVQHILSCSLDDEYINRNLLKERMNKLSASEKGVKILMCFYHVEEDITKDRR